MPTSGHERTIEATAGLFLHSYIVVSASDGTTPTVFRAGPGNTGAIFAQSQAYGPGSIDFTYSPTIARTVINDNRPASFYNQQLTAYQQAINAVAIPYSATSQNSNSFAAQGVEMLTGSRPQGPYYVAPGTQTVLPLTRDPNSNLLPSTEGAGAAIGSAVSSNASSGSSGSSGSPSSPSK